MLIEGFFGDHMFKQSMLLLVGILVCVSFVHAVDTITDVLEEGTQKSYIINGIDYLVSLDYVGGTILKAKFTINSEVTPSLYEGEKYQLKDGAILVVKDIIENEAGEAASGDKVTFNLTNENIKILNYTDYGVDTDDDGLYDYLIVELNLTVLQERSYYFYGALKDGHGNIIRNIGNYEMFLISGTHTIDMQFYGIQISLNEINGSYEFSYVTNESHWIDTPHYVFNTAEYNYMDFQKPGGKFTGLFWEEPQDTNGNGLYDYLTVFTEVNVTTPENFEIYGQLFFESVDLTDNDLESYTDLHLDEGVYTFPLQFNGALFYEYGVNGPYEPVVIDLIDQDHRILLERYRYSTAAYNYTEFEHELTNCTIPHDGMVITQNTTFCPGTYNLPNGIEIGADNVVLDCNGAVLNGTTYDIGGINIINKNYITIKNCILEYYDNGVYLKLSNNIKIINISARNLIGDGIYLRDSHNNKIELNWLANNGAYGIYLYNSTNNNLTKNTAINNLKNGFRLRTLSNSNLLSGNTVMNNNNSGIYSYYSNNNIYRKNIVLDNYDMGFETWNSNNTLFENNNVSNNGYNLIDINSASFFIAQSRNNTFTNNLADYSNHGFFISQSDINIISGNIITNNNKGIKLDSSHNSIIFNNNISNNNDGIFLESSPNNIISSNNVLNNYHGIYILESDNNTVINNNVNLNSWMGIYLDYSNNGIITDNTVNSNNIRGIELSFSNNNIISNNNVLKNNKGIRPVYSNNNVISNNNVNDNWDGIDISYSNNNIISYNNISRNEDRGIGLLNNVTNNTINNNNILNNHEGIYHNGIYNSSNGHYIYHNNFINNTNQVGTYSSGKSYWDNSIIEEGNSWSDFDEENEGCYDTNADGICDLPYIINTENQDNYPFKSISSWLIYSGCIVPTDDMIITENTTLCQGTYDLPKGIIIGADNIFLNCNNSVLNGNYSGIGFAVYNGIFADLRNNVVIMNCGISNYSVGIRLMHSKYSYLKNNNLDNNFYGIYLLENSDNNTISNNSILNSVGRGLNVDGSDYNSIYGNRIHNTNWEGLFIGALSYFNEVHDNTISNNCFKILNRGGIYSSVSDNNKIYHNNIISNNIQTGGSGKNLWDNTFLFGGNYWDNYDEENEGCYDINSDGICDAPYVINAENQDNYPFKKINGWLNYSGCTSPTNGMVITKNTTFCPGIYDLPNGISIGADNVVLDCNGAILDGNNTGNGIYMHANNNIIKNCEIRRFVWGVTLESSLNNSIQDNKIYNNSRFGIYMGDSQNNSILNNNIFNNTGVGIYLYSSSYNKIVKNRILNTSYTELNSADGIDIDHSNYNSISENDISNQEFMGIFIVGSSNNIISDNNILHNERGVSFLSSFSNYLLKNKIMYNWEGIRIYSLIDQSHSNLILENNFTMNEYASIEISDSGEQRTHNNTIWKNNIYNTNIYDSNEAFNIYCLNNTGNSYYDGASGPKCHLLEPIQSIVDYPEDSNGDGYYDYLNIEMNVSTVELQNILYIQAYLYDRFGNNIYRIDISEEEIANEENIEEISDTELFKLVFSGTSINLNGIDGPYVLKDIRIIGENQDVTINYVYNTSYYNYTDFQPPGAQLVNIYSESTLDLDNNGLFDYLILQTYLNITKADDYRIDATLSNNISQIISRPNFKYFFNEGIIPFNLSFNGISIYNSKSNGSYTLESVILRDDYPDVSLDSQSYVYYTSSFNYTEFEKPYAYFTDVFSDYGVDTDGNGLYDYLIIEVNMNSTRNENCRLAYEIGYPNAMKSYRYRKTISLINGSNVFYANITGFNIYKYGLNGTFKLSDLRLTSLRSFNTELIELDSRLYDNVYSTAFYNYTDFEYQVHEVPEMLWQGEIPEINMFGDFVNFQVAVSSPDDEPLSFTWYLDNDIVQENIVIEEENEEPVAEESIPEEVLIEEPEEVPAEEPFEISEEVEPEEEPNTEPVIVPEPEIVNYEYQSSIYRYFADETGNHIVKVIISDGKQNLSANWSFYVNRSIVNEMQLQIENLFKTDLFNGISNTDMCFIIKEDEDNKYHSIQLHVRGNSKFAFVSENSYCRGVNSEDFIFNFNNYQSFLQQIGAPTFTDWMLHCDGSRFYVLPSKFFTEEDHIYVNNEFKIKFCPFVKENVNVAILAEYGLSDCLSFDSSLISSLLCNPEFKCSSGIGENKYGDDGKYLCLGFYDNIGVCSYANNCYYSDECDPNYDYTFDLSLKRYPKPFVRYGKFNGTLILNPQGSPTNVLAASELAMNLQYHMKINIVFFNKSYYNNKKTNPIPFGFTVLSNQFNDTGTNLIIIDDIEHCNENSTILKYLNKSNCAEVQLHEGDPVITFINDNNRAVLLIMGRTAEENLEAVKAFVQGQDYVIPSPEVLVNPSPQPQPRVNTGGGSGGVCIPQWNCIYSTVCSSEATRTQTCHDTKCSRADKTETINCTYKESSSNGGNEISTTEGSTSQTSETEGATVSNVDNDNQKTTEGLSKISGAAVANLEISNKRIGYLITFIIVMFVIGVYFLFFKQIRTRK